eukprot:SAG31_NODE_11377_length_1037_cov_1.182303_1_plen_62_part_10
MTTEDGVLALIEDTCRGRAPLFTQQHEVKDVGSDKFDFAPVRRCHFVDFASVGKCVGLIGTN